VTIREATAEDWPAIWPFLRQICADGETYSYPRDISEDFAREIWLQKPPGRAVVAVQETADGADGVRGAGRVLGTAKMGPNQMGGGSHVATASFMVAPEAAGHGVGRALGEHVVAWARDAGYRAIQFNAVVESNKRAVHLWQSLGFQIMATLPEAFRSPTYGYVGLHVMYQTL
jgi:GNAT superfamily N-acetyltransferase